MSLEYFRMLNDELLNKYPYVFPKQSPLIILDKKSSIWLAKNGNDTKHTRNISRRMIFLEMVKNEIFTRKCGVREFYNCQTLEKRMFGNINWVVD